MKLRQIEPTKPVPNESRPEVQVPRDDWTSDASRKLKTYIFAVLRRVSEETNHIDLTVKQRRVLMLAAGLLPVVLPVCLVLLNSGEPWQEIETAQDPIQASLPIGTVSSAEIEPNLVIDPDVFGQTQPLEIVIDPILARLAAAEREIETAEPEIRDEGAQSEITFVEVDPFDDRSVPRKRFGGSVVSDQSMMDQLAGMKGMIEGEWFAFQSPQGSQESSLSEIGDRLSELDRLARQADVEYRVTIRSFDLGRSSGSSMVPSSALIYETLLSAALSRRQVETHGQRGVEVLIDWILPSDACPLTVDLSAEASESGDPLEQEVGP